MNKHFENPFIDTIYNGIVRENPTFVMVIGMCPVLAVTTTASNAIGMGLSTTAVLILSNMIIAALRHIIPDGVRMPAYIVIVATFVTVCDFLMEAYTPELYQSLGVYIPLIVVNCIILGRAEAYANKNTVYLSCADGIGMGIGFTIALLIISSVREILGAGEWFGNPIYTASDFFAPIEILIKSPGAFLVLAVLIAAKNKWKWVSDKKMEEDAKKAIRES
ncbi:MAG: electron transport complex subunit E [Lachnospiraceae bacterium]|nr:electron transport complex subunit E [Lachnospiraceae bacterium]MBR4208781.1 electron transport complex subunit E [Lachnospiraceae bacterium]